MHPRIPLAFLASKAHRLLMVNLSSTRTPRSLSTELLSSRSTPNLYWCHGVVPPQVQDPAFALVELHQVPLCPTLQPVQVSLNGSTAFWTISQSPQFCIISKLAEGTLCPFIQVIDEGEQDRAEYWPVGNPASYRPPTRLCAADGSPLSSAVHSVLNPPHRPLIQSTLPELPNEGFMEGTVKSLAEVELDNIHCLPLIYWAGHAIIESFGRKLAWCLSEMFVK